MTRLFVAVWPSPGVTEALASLPPDRSPGVRPVPPQNWHITLRFLGDVDATVADDVADRLRSVARARIGPTSAVLGPHLVHLGPRQVVVPVTGVDDMADTVATATADLGEPPRHPFTGHLTVARLRRGASSSLVGLPIEATFTVDEIALVASTLTPDGAVYETVETFSIVDAS